MDLTATAAIVTGGASGLGAATARALAAAGCVVTVADLDDVAGPAVAEEIGGAYRRVDVTDPATVAEAVEAAADVAPLRVAVACAGIGPGERLVHADGKPHGEAMFQRVVDVNQAGTFHLLRTAAAAMARSNASLEGERGVIVTTASIAAFEGEGPTVAYSASKAAVVGMTLPAARDLARHGIRVCSIAPGSFDTPMVAGASPARQAALAADVPFPRRLGRPEEFGALVIAIARISYLNGAVIRLDGGLRMGSTPPA